MVNTKNKNNNNFDIGEANNQNRTHVMKGKVRSIGRMNRMFTTLRE